MHDKYKYIYLYPYPYLFGFIFKFYVHSLETLENKRNENNTWTIISWFIREIWTYTTTTNSLFILYPLLKTYLKNTLMMKNPSLFVFPRKKITTQSAPFAPSSIKVQLPATKCKKEWWLEKMVCPFGGYKEWYYWTRNVISYYPFRTTIGHQ